jgi:hypothetical protein
MGEPVKRKPAAPTPGRSVVQRAYDFLEREGCSPRLLADGNPRFSELVFRYDGDLFLAGVDERDPDYLAVSFGLRLDPPPDEVTALRVANAVQDTHKLVKIGVDRDPVTLRFQTPVLLRGLPPNRRLLARCVEIIRHTAGEFEDLLRGTTQAQA